MLSLGGGLTLARLTYDQHNCTSGLTCRSPVRDIEASGIAFRAISNDSPTERHAPSPFEAVKLTEATAEVSYLTTTCKVGTCGALIGLLAGVGLTCLVMANAPA